MLSPLTMTAGGSIIAALAYTHPDAMLSETSSDPPVPPEFNVDAV